MPARNANAQDREPRRRGGAIRRVPPGTFRPEHREPDAREPDSRQPGERRRESERPALAMVLAPILGLGIWAAILFLLVGWLF